MSLLSCTQMELTKFLTTATAEHDVGETKSKKHYKYMLLIFIFLISLINLGYLFLDKLNADHFDLIIKKILSHPRNFTVEK